MKLSGKYRLEVIRDHKVVNTVDITNTITTSFLEHMSQVLAGNVTTPPKYAGFGLGIGTSVQGAFYTELENEVLRVPIDTVNTTGTGVLVTEKVISSATLIGAGITQVTELGIFCVDDTDNEATVSSTVDTGVLVSRVSINIEIEAGDEFIIKRTDTLTGG